MDRIIFSIFIILLVGFLPNAFAEIKVETFLDNVKYPWELEFAPDGTIFFTERDGKLWMINNESKKQLVAEFLPSLTAEGGLLGLELDPDYKNNHFLYLYQTYFETNVEQNTSELILHWNKVVRYTVNNDQLTEELIIIDKIPGGEAHDGGRIKFGPDEMLYISTGDIYDGNLAQNLDSLAGKILRINSDGTIPSDNPFDSAVFSYGHRNSQGLAWNENGVMVATEHGPSGHQNAHESEKGHGYDEINVIEKGKNYGWPIVVGESNDSLYTNPFLLSREVTWAPSGLLYYNSDKIPEWEGKFLVANLRGQHIMLLDLDLEKGIVNSVEKIFHGTIQNVLDKKEKLNSQENLECSYNYVPRECDDGEIQSWKNIIRVENERLDRIIEQGDFSKGEYGRIRNMVQTPDGDVLVLTSNGAKMGINIDKILKISNVDNVPTEIPDWIKTTAGWWATDRISENEFVIAIEFLIKEKIILVDVSQTSINSQGVPDWIKTTAGWWATDRISENEFVIAIEFLVNEGIIQVNSLHQPIIEREEFGRINNLNCTEPCIPETFLLVSTTWQWSYDTNQYDTFHSLDSSVFIRGGGGLVPEEENMSLYDQISITTDKQNAVVIFPEASLFPYSKPCISDYHVETTSECFSVNMLSESEKSFEYKADNEIVQHNIDFTKPNPLNYYPIWERSNDQPLEFSFTRSLFLETSNLGVQALDILDYPIISDLEIEKNPEILSNYDKVIVLHNKYVTKTMFDSITNHPKVVYLYPGALFEEITIDFSKNIINVVNPLKFPQEKNNQNDFQWEYDSEYLETKICGVDVIDIKFEIVDNGIMLNCNPELNLGLYPDLFKIIKDF
jgi:glucose/arabinose dehydrogenase